MATWMRTGIGLVGAALICSGSERIADEIAFDADELRPEELDAATRTPADRFGLAAVAIGIAGIVFAAIGAVNLTHSLVRILLRELAPPDAHFLAPGERGFFLREDLVFLLSSCVRIGIGAALYGYRFRLAEALARAPDDVAPPAGTEAEDDHPPPPPGREIQGDEGLWER